MALDFELIIDQASPSSLMNLETVAYAQKSLEKVNNYKLDILHCVYSRVINVCDIDSEFERIKRV